MFSGLTLLRNNLNKIIKSWSNVLPKRNRACLKHSHNAIFHWNYQKYSVKILYAIIDWVFGISKIMHCEILINMPYSPALFIIKDSALHSKCVTWWHVWAQKVLLSVQLWDLVNLVIRLFQDCLKNSDIKSSQFSLSQAHDVKCNDLDDEKCWSIEKSVPHWTNPILN